MGREMGVSLREEEGEGEEGEEVVVLEEVAVASMVVK